MHALLKHLRYTVRLLRKSPGFTVTAVLIVAFGVGVNTAIFSLIDSVILKPLPYPDQDRLVEVCFPQARLFSMYRLNSMYADRGNWPEPQKKSFGIRPENRRLHPFRDRSSAIRKPGS